MQHKVVELIAYPAGNSPRRAATIRLDDGRYFDIIEDDDGNKSIDVTCITDAKETFINIPPNGGKMYLVGPPSELSRIK